MSPSWTKAHDSTKKLHMKPMQLSVCKQHAFPEILSLLSSKISPSHTPRSTLECRACSGVSTNVIDVVSKGAHHGPKWKIIYVPQHDYSRCILPIPKQYDAWKPWKLWKLSFFSAMCSFLPLLWGPTCCRFLLLFIFFAWLSIPVSFCCLHSYPFFLVSVSFLNPLVQTSCPGLTFTKRVSFADLYLHKLNLETKWNQ